MPKETIIFHSAHHLRELLKEMEAKEGSYVVWHESLHAGPKVICDTDKNTFSNRVKIWAHWFDHKADPENIPFHGYRYWVEALGEKAKDAFYQIEDPEKITYKAIRKDEIYRIIIWLQDHGTEKGLKLANEYLLKNF